MNPQDSRDEPRDPHLVAALRHAPDHDAVPPAQLTTAILGHAERALRKPPAAAPSRWREAWVRLWQPAPMAAFGTIATTTLVGVMWMGQELPEVTPELPRVPAAAPAAAPAVEHAASALPFATTATTATPAAPAPTPAPAVRRPPAPLEAEARRDSAAPPVARAPASSVGLAGAAAPVGAAPVEALAKSLADAAPAAARARSERSSQSVGTAAPAPNSPLATAAAEIDAAVGTDAGRVRWRVAGERLVAHGPSQRNGWTALADATQGRWQPVAPAPADAAESSGVVLLIDGAPRGVLVFEAQALVWRDARGTAWRAPLDAQTLLDWRETLARW